MKSTRTIWLVFCLVGFGGCASSPSAVPLSVPALGSSAAAETTYVGQLVRSRPGAGPALGWQLRNVHAAGAVPLDVTTVVNSAQTLVGQVVLVTAHSAQEPGGRLVLKADAISAYTPPQD